MIIPYCVHKLYLWVATFQQHYCCHIVRVCHRIVWKSEENLRESVPSFRDAGLAEGPQVRHLAVCALPITPSLHPHGCVWWLLAVRRACEEPLRQIIDVWTSWCLPHRSVSLLNHTVSVGTQTTFQNRLVSSCFRVHSFAQVLRVYSPCLRFPAVALILKILLVVQQNVRDSIYTYRHSWLPRKTL